jgi:hypothetical protein
MTQAFSEWVRRPYAATLLLAIGLNALALFLVWEPWVGVQFWIILGLNGISLIALGASIVFLAKNRRAGGAALGMAGSG